MIIQRTVLLRNLFFFLPAIASTVSYHPNEDCVGSSSKYSEELVPSNRDRSLWVNILGEHPFAWWDSACLHHPCKISKVNLIWIINLNACNRFILARVANGIWERAVKKWIVNRLLTFLAMRTFRDNNWSWIFCDNHLNMKYIDY